MTVAVVGLGLIGGSICKAIRANTGDTILGIDQDAGVISRALSCGAIHEAASPSQLVRADVTIVCLYPRETAVFLSDHADTFHPGSLVMDVCGVKESVVLAAQDILRARGVTFIGAHPMAGREFSGFDYSDAALFNGASLILTPPLNTTAAESEAVRRIETYAQRLGFGRIVKTTPQIHDRRIAYTSQLAHVVSNAYVKSPALLEQAGFSAGSFLDLTRVAKLNEDMWSTLMIQNRAALAAELRVLMGSLSEYLAALESSDENRLRVLLREGRLLKEQSLAEGASQ